MTNPNSIIVDGQTYVRADLAPEPSPIKIVILQRGWCMVGRYAEYDDRIILTGTQVIRRWGTTRGLGEIAAGGPTGETVLDPAGRVEIHKLTTVAVLDCDPAVWESRL